MGNPREFKSTAVALFKSALRAGASRYGRLSFVVCRFVVLSFVLLAVGWLGRWVVESFDAFGVPSFGHAVVSFGCLVVLVI